MASKIIFCAFATILSMASPAEGKEWRGIVPLQSTRADVERLLGPSPEKCKCTYYKENITVFVVYASGAPCGKEELNRWKVARDTVINLTVYYKKPSVKFSDLKIDESKYQKETSEHLPGVVHYINRDEGLELEVIGETVQSITYFSSARDKHLRCDITSVDPPSLTRSGFHQIRSDGIGLPPSAILDVNGWRGIVPLHSTRADVERVLGPPTEQLAGYSVFYRTANETVIVDYTRGLPCGIGEKYSQWRVPRNTVVSIFITPYMGSPLSQLSIDESKYKKFSGGHTPDLYYINECEGERLTVFGDVVKSISYFPAAEDAHLECPGLPSRSDTNCEGLPPAPFESYGNLPLAEEKLRLDEFMITLKEGKERKGYILAYAGKRARLSEAKEHAERAKRYLVNVRGFPAARLYTIDGGYREKPKVELYVVDGSDCPPTSDPTVDPRDVQIIRDGRGKKNRRSP